MIFEMSSIVSSRLILMFGCKNLRINKILKKQWIGWKREDDICPKEKSSLHVKNAPNTGNLLEFVNYR